MATSTETPLPSTRTRPEPAPGVLSRRDGIFAGVVLLIFGMIWFLDVTGVVPLQTRFGDILLPLLMILAGVYLLIVKLVRA